MCTLKNLNIFGSHQIMIHLKTMKEGKVYATYLSTFRVEFRILFITSIHRSIDASSYSVSVYH